MRIYAIPLLLAVVIGAACMGSDLDKMAGNWKCDSAISDGKAIPEETVKKLRLTVTKEGGYKTTRGDEVLFDSTFKLDSEKTPKHIDFVGTEGENKGKIAPGIYTLEGDKLTICNVMPGKERPKALESKSGQETTLVVWKRGNP